MVPSNTLSSEEFKARCIDVMTGSVRRTDEVSIVKAVAHTTAELIEKRVKALAQQQHNRGDV